MRLLYLCGEPGVGKTWTMDQLTEGWTRLPLPPEADAPARDALMTGPDGTGSVAAVELGRRRDTFSGTDALPQTVIGLAERYLWTPEAPLLLCEGARLANRRFLSAAVEADWRVVLALLSGAEAAGARRRARADALGVREQHPAWVLGRRTAAYNLAQLAPALGCTVIGLDAAAEPRELAGILAPVIGVPA